MKTQNFHYFKRITKNAVRCKICDTVIESLSRHHFVWCVCSAVAVDGGKDYLKRVFNSQNEYEELSTEENFTVEEAKEAIEGYRSKLLEMPYLKNFYTEAMDQGVQFLKEVHGIDYEIV